MFTHIAVVRDLVAMQYKEYQEVRISQSNINIKLYKTAHLLTNQNQALYAQHCGIL